MGLQIEKLDVTLRGQQILKKIDLHVQHGEMVALLGESGSGKSTLLKSIAGLVPVERGEIVLGARRLNDLAPEKRRAVIVFQDLRLFPHLTVERNISFAMEIQKRSPEFQREQVKKLLELVRLSGFEKRRIKEISGGQMQRVALARALASEPDILLLDEPFSGLDEKLRVDMADLVCSIQREKQITTILVTHDRTEALRVADKVVLMQDGEILQAGSPYEMFYSPVSLAVAEYFGRVNVVGGRFLRPSRICLEKGGDYEIARVSFLGDQVELRIRKKGSGERFVYDAELAAFPEELFCTMNSEGFFEQEFGEGSPVTPREVR